MQAPVGATEADVVVVLQALLDRHAMLRLRVNDDGAGNWSLQVPEAGSVDARQCLHTVDVLTDEAVIEARSRLNPAAGVMLSALWVASADQLVAIVHHLAIDGVSWRILLEDLNIAWAQHHSGQPVELPTPGTSFARWAELLAEYAHRPEVVEQAQVWRQISATPAALRYSRAPCAGGCWMALFCLSSSTSPGTDGRKSTVTSPARWSIPAWRNCRARISRRSMRWRECHGR